MLVNPLLIEKAMEQRLLSGKLPVSARVRVDPSEEAKKPIGKVAVWVRYYESSSFPEIPSGDTIAVSQQRVMSFQCFTDVLDLRNHEQSLTIHTAAIGLLTNFIPSVPGVLSPLTIRRDRFERLIENRWQYRADFEILTEHQYVNEIPVDFWNGFVPPEVLEVGLFNDEPGKLGDTSNKDADISIYIPRPVRILPKSELGL